MRISVIIPTLDSSEFLPGLLKHLTQQEVAEVIIADRGSRDATVAVARQYGADVSRTPDSDIRTQLNGGLNLASSRVIWHLMPNSHAPMSAATQILDALDAKPDAVGGFFKLSDQNISFMENASKALSGIIGSDECPASGTFFTREALVNIGGFPEALDPLQRAYQLIRPLGEFMRMRQTITLLAEPIDM